MGRVVKYCEDFDVQCCQACHEDVDMGYQLPEFELKDGNKVTACCYIMEELFDKGLVDA